MSDPCGPRADVFLNPVYPRSFPDPFVLKFRGEYFAYCTGFSSDGTVFGVLRSCDLVTWDEVGGAMKPLDSSPPYYWAPEVFYENGRFYLYYSVGNETFMEIRVAVSDRPDGGFVDSGTRLTNEEFAIDAHVFIDDDGTKYLFYATDFLEHTHIGTGTVVDRMTDWFTLEGKPRPVTRARYDWQVYDPERKEKGGVRWHTIEGPAVLKRKAVYYEMFSGGNWQNTTYGVSFAVAGSIREATEWKQFCDGENILPILRTIPDLVIGPGHNCVVRGPNNRELFCVYHRWTGDDRVMAIDRMDFAGSRIFITGATNTPQPAPFVPQIRVRPGDERLAPGVTMKGDWRSTATQIVSDPYGRCEINLGQVAESFLLELTWSLALADPVDQSVSAGEFGALIETGAGPATIVFDPHLNRVLLNLEKSVSVIELRRDFVWAAPHVLRLEIDFRRVKIQIDDRSMQTEGLLGGPATGISIFSSARAVAVLSLELTEGFEELFDGGEPLTENGWTFDSTHPPALKGNELVIETRDRCQIAKGPPLRSLEIATNLRTLDDDPREGEFGLVLLAEERQVFRLAVDCGSSRIVIDGTAAAVTLPTLSTYHQMRMAVFDGRVICYLDGECIGEFPVPRSQMSAAIFCDGVPIAIEMIRLTSLETHV